MARAAGDSSFYELGIIDSSGLLRGVTIKLPSVTTCLKVLPKGDAMTWWGYKLGIKATAQYVLDYDTFPGGDVESITEELYTKVKEERKFTPNTELKKGGDKGTNLHEWAEHLLLTGDMPIAREDVAPEHRNRADELVRFYREHEVRPGVCIRDLKVVQLEKALFSLKAPADHKYIGVAGTPDAVMVDENQDVPVYYTLDWKTSKDIYPNFLVQATTYDKMAKERGVIPAEAVTIPVVVNFREKGRYQARQAHGTLEQFWSIKKAWETCVELGLISVKE